LQRNVFALFNGDYFFALLFRLFFQVSTLAVN
jgi:hypothetical protein